jgi:transcriptional regulator with XRE-family HTH domain
MLLLLSRLKKDINLVELGNRIRAERKAGGLSQEDLAYKAGVDRSYVGGIERGERNVSFLTLIKIAECLECDIAKFTKGIPK